MTHGFGLWFVLAGPGHGFGLGLVSSGLANITTCAVCISTATKIVIIKD